MNESLSSAEVNNTVTIFAETYGVNPDDVTVSVAYEISGSMDMEITGAISTQELEEAIQDDLAELLGIHRSKIEVTSENGTIHYTIKSDTTEDAKDIQSSLFSESSTATLNDVISKSFPVVISGVNVNDEVTADIAVQLEDKTVRVVVPVREQTKVWSIAINQQIFPSAPNVKVILTF